MFFFNKVKARACVITGRRAEIYPEAEKISFTGAFKIPLRVRTGDAGLKINQACIKIPELEEVSIPDERYFCRQRHKAPVDSDCFGNNPDSRGIELYE